MNDTPKAGNTIRAAASPHAITTDDITATPPKRVTPLESPPPHATPHQPCARDATSCPAATHPPTPEARKRHPDHATRTTHHRAAPLHTRGKHYLTLPSRTLRLHLAPQGNSPAHTAPTTTPMSRCHRARTPYPAVIAKHAPTRTPITQCAISYACAAHLAPQGSSSARIATAGTGRLQHRRMRAHNTHPARHRATPLYTRAEPNVSAYLATPSPVPPLHGAPPASLVGHAPISLGGISHANLHRQMHPSAPMSHPPISLPVRLCPLYGSLFNALCYLWYTVSTNTRPENLCGIDFYSWKGRNL